MGVREGGLTPWRSLTSCPCARRPRNAEPSAGRFRSRRLRYRQSFWIHLHPRVPFLSERQVVLDRRGSTRDELREEAEEVRRVHGDVTDRPISDRRVRGLSYRSK